MENRKLAPKSRSSNTTSSPKEIPHICIPISNDIIQVGIKHQRRFYYCASKCDLRVYNGLELSKRIWPNEKKTWSFQEEQK